MRMRSSLLSSVAVAVLFAAPALAQTMQTAPTQTRPMQAQPMPAQQPPHAAGAGTERGAMGAHTLSPQDMTFIKDAAIGGQAEVELGRLAEQNGQSQGVKQFGARMVRDHSAANSELIAIATGKGATLPQQLDREHAQLRDRLAGLRGEAFDRAYIRAMLEDHDKDLKAFRHEAQAGGDADIKRFATQTAQTIAEHDRMAHELDRSLSGIGSSRPTHR